MKRITRIIGFAFSLILLFVGALILTAGWLRTQNDRLRIQTIAARSAQFSALLDLAKAGPPPWNEELEHRLERAIDATIATTTPNEPAIAAPARGGDNARWRFRHEFLDTEGRPVAWAEVTLPLPATVRALAVLQRVSAVLLVLALTLLLALLLVVVFDRRWIRSQETLAGADSSVPPVGDYGVLSQLAARSARQSVELEREREDRQRAEGDAHLKQILLNRALQEKIDMGRDLHDGLIQSLYATGLTIQAGRKAIDQDPALARQQIETALTTLNNAIREVRTYISGLGPEKLQQRSFADSVRAIIESLSAVREIASDIRIDEDTAQQLSADHVTDLLQIVREAVSNSLRHGHARQIAVRLHRNAHELCLLVHDDGRGFDLSRATRGHGLDNMQARANRLGARLDCQSEPGRGTRLVLTFTAPVPPSRP